MASPPKPKEYRRPVYQFKKRDRIRTLVLELSHKQKLNFSEANQRLRSLTEIEFKEATTYLLGQGLIKPLKKRRTRGNYIKSITGICERLVKTRTKTVPRGWDAKIAKLVGCSPLTVSDVRRAHGIYVK